ncbi:MAG: MBL fold metallo-hydrolase [Crocinitomicaceae bacterium]
MKVKKFTFNGFQENTYIVSDELKNCVIIDPGCYETHEKETLFQYIEKEQLTPVALLNTHAHIDHVMGNAAVLEKYPIDFYLHSEDIPTLHAVAGYAHLYGFPGYIPSPSPTKILKGGETLKFGEIEFDVIFGPGHAPGHVAFYSSKHNFVINGDILFQGSFGRVDLPGGDIETLKETIFEKMFKLPEDTLVYCGHGSETTIGTEKKSNMILNY